MAAEFLRKHPDIADDKTQLSRETLTDQLALIFNSNTVLTSRGELFPGGAQADSYYEDAPFLQGSPESVTPGSELLVEILAALGQSFDTIPSYSVALLASLDVDQIIDSPATMLSFEADELEMIGQALTVVLDVPSLVTSTTSTSSTLAPRPPSQQSRPSFPRGPLRAQPTRIQHRWPL